MGKTLNELARDLKESIIGFQSDAHNIKGVDPRRYNNLKLTMDIAKNPKPHIIVTLALSEAQFSLKTGEKEQGGLGPDERYVLKWLEKSGNLYDLQEVWKGLEKNRGKAYVVEED